jgi:GMP synthase (glutamine-hydrolysing)
MSARILLLQARNPDDSAKHEELASFVARLGIPEEQITPFDLLNGRLTLSLIRSYDALMMGGSGEYYVSKRNLPSFEWLLEVLAEVAEVGHPTFASCFGFQCLVEALGGEIIHDPVNTEVGTFPIQLTTAGRDDPLLGHLPNPFLAQLGRKDRASRLPEGYSCLAFSDRSPYQAFRVAEYPVWAFQFHPELNLNDNRLRFERYLDGYAAHMTVEEQKETLNQFKESPETEKLLPQFMELVFG